MNAENNKTLPLPLIILCLIITFFIGLTLSLWYFQTKLDQINSSSIEKTYWPTEKNSEALTIGVNTTSGSEKYITQVANYLSNELGSKTTIKNIPQGDIFNSLDNHQVDFIISSDTNIKIDDSNYNYTGPDFGTDQIIITLKKNSQLQGQLDYALNSLIIKGTLNDLKQNWLK